MRGRNRALGAFLLLALAFPATLLAQLDQRWVATYNGPYTGSGSDAAAKVVVDTAGNVYVTGYSETYTPYQNNYNTVKYDADGEVLWTVQYDGPAHGYDWATGLAVDDWGNVFVIGRSPGSGTNMDYATVKYNSSGVEQWVRRYNGPANGNDQANAVVVDASGNVYVIGSSAGSGTGNDFAAVKYDAAGNELWVMRYNGPANGSDQPNAIVVDASGNVLVTGQSATLASYPYNYDYATIKYNSSGVEQWVARYNGPASGSDQARSIAIDASGNVFVTGQSRGTNDDYATVKYSSSGAEQWVSRYNGPGNSGDGANAIVVDPSGNSYVTGSSGGSGTGGDFATIKYNPSGVEQWVARYNGPGNGGDGGNAIVIDGSGNSYVTGTCRGSTTGNDYATVKYNASGVEQWVAMYAGYAALSDYGQAIALDPWDNVCVTGYSYNATTYSDYLTIKYTSSGSQLWVARYSYPLGSFDYGQKVAMDASGNAYLAGFSTDAQGFDGDYVTIKYNTAGAEQWVARYDGPAQNIDQVYALAVDATGNAYVTGQSYGTGTNYDYATIKYDTDGNQLWVVRYNGLANDWDVATAIALDASGNVYVTGNSTGSGTGGDYATIKYDANGNQLWLARWASPGSGWDKPYAIAVDATGNVYVTGGGAGDYTTVKYNASGAEQWVARYNGPGNSSDLAYAIGLDGLGNCYVAGYSYGTGTSVDYATVKYDVNGVQQWVARYNGPGNSGDYAYGMAADASGTCYVTGYSTGSGTGYDYATIKYDANGNQLWVARYNGPGNGTDYANAIAIDAWGNSYVTGYSMGTVTGYDCTTIKYDAGGSEMGLARYDGLSSLGDYGYSIAVGPSGDVCVAGISQIVGHSGDYLAIMYHSPLGWASRSELPELPSGKREGAGGWLAYNAANRLIYAAKGESTADFYAYDTRTNNWASLAPIPAGSEQVLPQDGCRGVTDGVGCVYMTKGANTLGFWKYTISTASWSQLGDVPAGKHYVKGGTDLAYAVVDNVGYVYLLKGQDREFCRYNTQTGEWSRLTDAPRGKNGQWLAGSWLVYDGDHSLYAHKALSQEMYRFDITTGDWDPTALTGMPQESRYGGKLQLGPGGCAACLDGAVYALKGNNTNQLWAYVPGDGWHELDAMPETGTSGQKKRVHLGGDITGTENMLFAFKGSKTNELWRFVPDPEQGFGGASARTGSLPIRFSLSAYPNPMVSATAIRYSVPVAGTVSLKLYDVTGALARTVCSGRLKPGSYTANLSARGLARGVYVLKLQTDACSLTRKVIIE